jgi:hypothetical protein
MTPDGNAPVFICGVGRSGTSLLQSMLGSHSQLAFPPETSFLRRYVAGGGLVKKWRLGGFPAVTSLLREDRHVTRVWPQLEAVLEKHARGDMLEPAAVYHDLLREYASRQGKPRFGDKDPRSIEYLRLIAELWPQAYVVHIVRDPRDVLSSKKQAEWSRGRHPALHVFANMVQFRLGRSQGTRRFGDRYIELTYEDLISDPERVLRSVAERLGLGYEPGMLEYGATARTLVAPDEMGWKKETLGELLSNNRGKWEATLTDWETSLTELLCGEAFDAGGYNRSDRMERLPLVQRVSVRAVALLLRKLGAVYSFHRSARINQRLRFLRVPA